MFEKQSEKLNVFLLAVILLGQVQPVAVSAVQIVANNQKATESTSNTDTEENAADTAATSAFENLPVRDTLNENTPSWLTFNDDVKVDPSDIAPTGSLSDKDFVIAEIPGNETVNITYSMSVNEIPDNVVDVTNIVTIDGTDTCDSETDDCDSTISLVEGDTIINKSVSDENSDKVVQKR